MERRSRPPTRRKTQKHAGGRNPGDAAEASPLAPSTTALASTESKKAGDGATAAPGVLKEGAGVQGTAGTDEGRRDNAACLAEFSDGQTTPSVVDAGVCEQKNGGECVPCFEIM